MQFVQLISDHLFAGTNVALDYKLQCYPRDAIPLRKRTGYWLVTQLAPVPSASSRVRASLCIRTDLSNLFIYSY